MGAERLHHDTIGTLTSLHCSIAVMPEGHVVLYMWFVTCIRSRGCLQHKIALNCFMISVLTSCHGLSDGPP